MKKICFLAPANNYHTKKWCGYFLSKGYKVSVISFFQGEINDAKVYCLNDDITAQDREIRKIKYLFNGKKIRNIISEEKPDIISVHYASSYGLAAALARLNNYYLSVWGADVYEFPKKSFIHKIAIRVSLNSAKKLLSTSKAMAEETRKYTKKYIEITPFGVKMDLFSPNKRQSENEEFTIGTIKALEPKYGIDYLIRAVAIIKEREPGIPLKVRIAGKGEYREEYECLATNLGVSDIITWLGFINQEQVASEWAKMDVAIVPSIDDSESFGVSAVEAQACGTPVVISDVPGLMEATKPGITSIVVKRRNAEAIAENVLLLYHNKSKRLEMGKHGRDFVAEQYEYNRCFEKIESIFKET